jgi:hypothetical protein
MHRFIRPLLLLLVLAAPGGCDDGAPWGSDDATPAGEPPADFGPSAAYERRLVFLGPGSDLPTAAILDFTALSDSAGVRRGARVRWLDAGEWRQVMDAGWEMAPLRDPWRVLPHGPLKVVVNDAGEIGAVSYRGEPSLRLESGRILAESSPDAGTQLVLRQARLMVADEEAVMGVLLDAQLGRPVRPSGRTPGAAAPDSTALAGDTLPPTPVARAGAEALLVADSGYHAVLASSASGELAWISYGGRDEIRREVALEPIAWADFREADIQVPTGWRITAPEGQVTGELMAEVADHAALPDLGDVAALGYVLVSGWIEDRGVLHEVFGIIRHVR